MKMTQKCQGKITIYTALAILLKIQHKVIGKIDDHIFEGGLSFVFNLT